MEGLVLALPWWEPCADTVPEGKSKLAEITGAENDPFDSWGLRIIFNKGQFS